MHDDSAVRLPPKSKIIQLLKALDSHKTKIATANGTISERLKLAVDDDNIDTQALKTVLKEIRMRDELKRKAFQRNVAHYRAVAEEAGLFGDVHEGDIAEQADELEAVARPDQAALDHAASGGIRQLEHAAE